MALYEQTFGKIPGTYYMDQFKMVTDMMAAQPTWGKRTTSAPTPQLPRLMALMDRQEMLSCFGNSNITQVQTRLQGRML